MACSHCHARATQRVATLPQQPAESEQQPHGSMATWGNTCFSVALCAMPTQLARHACTTTNCAPAGLLHKTERYVAQHHCTKGTPMAKGSTDDQSSHSDENALASAHQYFLNRPSIRLTVSPPATTRSPLRQPLGTPHKYRVKPKQRPHSTIQMASLPTTHLTDYC